MLAWWAVSCCISVLPLFLFFLPPLRRHPFLILAYGFPPLRGGPAHEPGAEARSENEVRNEAEAVAEHARSMLADETTILVGHCCVLPFPLLAI